MSKKMIFDNHGLSVFSQYGIDAVGLKNFMVDMALKRDIFDTDGNKISKMDAEDKLREINLAFFGLEPGFTTREFHRATDTNGKQWFQILEEVEDVYIEYGMRENEFFNRVVNYRSRALGQDNIFYIDPDEITLIVSRVGMSHHDLALQRLNAGTSYQVPVFRYGAAVGLDINRYLAGQEDWAKLVETLGKSFIIKQQNEILAQVMTAATKLPVQSGFVDTGALSSSTKSSFDKIIYNVSLANDNAPVVIFGTQLGLKQINNLADVEWADNDTKKIMTNTGRLGYYEGATLVEIPNRFADKTLTNHLFDDTKLIIMAADAEYKLVDMYTMGETEIQEYTEKGESNTSRLDDIGKYEIQMSWGTDVRVRRMFGQWTLASV